MMPLIGWRLPVVFVCSRGLTHEDRWCERVGRGPLRFAYSPADIGVMACFRCVDFANGSKPIQARSIDPIGAGRVRVSPHPYHSTPRDRYDG